MGWELAGYACERGSTNVAPAPSDAGLASARAAAERVAQRFEVEFVSRDGVQEWHADAARTTSCSTCARARNSRRATSPARAMRPAAKSVQATDEFAAVRNARMVLIDPRRVRSVMTASWLNQMGWDEVYALEPEGGRLAGCDVARVPRNETRGSCPRRPSCG